MPRFIAGLHHLIKNILINYGCFYFLIVIQVALRRHFDLHVAQNAASSALHPPRCAPEIPLYTINSLPP
jgi:hypothetical protein